MPGPIIRVVSITLAIALLMPGLAAQQGRPVEDGPLARMVEIAFANSLGGPLSGKICTALGITKNNQSFPVEQLSSTTGGNGRSFNVSRNRDTGRN
jgi:hypothetical protein